MSLGKIKTQILGFSTWSSISKLVSSPLLKITSITPIIGYVILWSDEFKKYWEFTNLSPKILFFSADERLYFLYMGGILVLVGYVFFHLLCPEVTKHHKSSQLLFRDLVSDFNLSLVSVYLFKAFKYLNNRGIPFNDKNNVERIRKTFVTQEAVEGGNVTRWDGNKTLRILERDSMYREDFSVLMSIYYRHLDQSKPFSRVLVLFFVIFGLTIFILPSIEIFVMVLIKLLGL